MRPILAMYFCVAPSFLLGCSLINTFDLREDTIETCTNGKDDDGDGLSNCFDPECVVLVRDLVEKEGWSVQEVMDRGLISCLEVTDELCQDGEDNDMDGFIDCRDSGCTGLDPCLEDTVGHCHDGSDNDMDGFIDCRDPGCTELDSCQENTDEHCHDGIDNDMDGILDCDEFDCIETPSCQALSQENDAVSCGDGADNDGDGKVDCADPDCHSASVEVCDPSEYSHLIFEDHFSSPVEEDINWDIYEFTSVDIPDSQWGVSGEGGRWHIWASTNPSPGFPFRTEKGIYSKRFFDLWGNITDIVVNVTVADNENHTPVVVGLAIDSTMEKPFLEKVPLDGSEPMGRKAILVLLVDGLGRMQLCARKIDNDLLQCSPESGPLEPVDAFAPGDNAIYRISIDDSFVSVYQKVGENPQRLMLGIPNPYDPGIARLFLVASTDKAGEQGRSEMFVDEIQVFQPPSAPQVTYQMEDGLDPEWTMTGSNESCSYHAEENAMDVSWSGSSNCTCSVFVGPGISEGRFQTTYRFVASGLRSEAYFLPGLWDPLMNFSLGMAFAAGVYTSQDAYTHYFFVFRPCSSSNPDETNYEYWESLEGVWLRATAGHNPERNFSYVLFQDAVADRDTDTDIVSYVKYGTACFNLTQFGFTTQYTPATSIEAAAYGLINEVKVTKYP